MSIVKKVNISGVQNLERYFAEFAFTPVGKHDLEKVEYRDNEVTLYFDEEENPSAKNFVKQGSIKKYEEKIKEKLKEAEKNESKGEIKYKNILEAKIRAEVEGLFIQNVIGQKCQTQLAKIQTDKHILFFFSEKCREKKGLFW